MLEQRERVYAANESNEWVPSQIQRMSVKEKKREEKEEERKEKKKQQRWNDKSTMLFPFSADWTRLEGPPSTY